MNATSSHPPGNHGEDTTNPGRHARSRPRRRRRAGAVPGVLLGAAGSTLVTVIAATAAGYQADRILQPIEFTLRVLLILAAPCVGAAAANWLLTAAAGRHVEPPPAWAVGLGALAGPAVVLRLDQVIDYGTDTMLVTGAVMAAWAGVATALTTAVNRRSTTGGDRTTLPPPPGPPGGDDDPAGR